MKKMYWMLAAALTGAMPMQLQAAPDQANDDQLQAVVVTAERRGEDPQKMAVSIIALSQDDLTEKGVKTVADLQAIAPSLSYVDNGNVKFINIRGVGINEAAPNQTDGVATYLDGAYIAREYTTDDAYFDLDSVDVLRGPQGTYVGENSTGGAIFLTTKKPSLDGIEGYVQQTFGSYAYRSTEAAANVPFNDVLAFRASVIFETRDSFTKNFGPIGVGDNTPGITQPGNLNRQVGRFQVLYKPTENIDVHVLYQHSERNTDGLPYQYIDAATLSHPFTANYDFPGKYDLTYDRTSATLDWQFVPSVKLHAVSSYQNTNQFTQVDTDGTSPGISPGVPQTAYILPLHEWYYTNEADLVSSLDGPFQWTAGAAMLVYNQWFADQILGYTDAPDYSSGLYLNFRAFRKNVAGFGEVSYEISPQWEVKAGVRENHDQVGLRAGSYLDPIGPNGGLELPAGPNIQSFNATTGRVLVNFKPADGELAYFLVSRGYKPGGWTPNVAEAVTGNNIYGAETVTNYELGLKSTLFDNHFRSAIDVFRMNYQGFQATISTPPDPTTSITKNVSGTIIQGFEAQIDATQWGFDLGFGFSFLDAKFGNLEIYEPAGEAGLNIPATATQINLNGRTIDYAPRVSGNISLSYQFDLGAAGKLTPRLQWTYQAGQWTSFYDAPQDYMPAYALGSARLSWEPKKNWRLDAYVTNLTDRVYFANSGGNNPETWTVLFGAPRQYGATLNYKF